MLHYASCSSISPSPSIGTISPIWIAISWQLRKWIGRKKIYWSVYLLFNFKHCSIRKEIGIPPKQANINNDKYTMHICVHTSFIFNSSVSKFAILYPISFEICNLIPCWTSRRRRRQNVTQNSTLSFFTPMLQNSQSCTL